MGRLGADHPRRQTYAAAAARPPARQRLRRWNATAGPVATKILIAINVVLWTAVGWMLSRAGVEGRGWILVIGGILLLTLLVAIGLSGVEDAE